MGERDARNFEWLVSYSHEHGVIGRPIPLDELFLNVSEGRNRNASGGGDDAARSGL